MVDDDGRLAARQGLAPLPERRDAVFSFAAHTTSSSVVVTGPSAGGGAASWSVGDPALDAALSTACDAPVAVLPEDGVPHFDADAVSLVGTATLDWCRRELGIDADVRRLRTNIVVETTEPFIEETWVGSTVAIGSVELAVSERVERCRTIDLAQDGVATTTSWLKALGASRELCVAVYAGVVTPGALSVGDAVTVEGLDEDQRRLFPVDPHQLLERSRASRRTRGSRRTTRPRTTGRPSARAAAWPRPSWGRPRWHQELRADASSVLLWRHGDQVDSADSG